MRFGVHKKQKNECPICWHILSDDHIKIASLNWWIKYTLAFSVGFLIGLRLW